MVRVSKRILRILCDVHQTTDNLSVALSTNTDKVDLVRV